MYKSLGEFVGALEAAGELRRVRAAVSPVLEIAEIADRVSKSRAPYAPSDSARRNDPRFFDRGGPALLFEKVAGSDFPLLINAWGSYRRMEMAIGCDAGGHTPGGFDAIGAKIGELVKPEPPRSLGQAIEKAKQFLPLLFISPKRKGGSAACQEVVKTGDAVDVTRLPALRCWPMDGDYEAVGYPGGLNDRVPELGRGEEWERAHRGRYITLAGIHTIHADDIDEAKPASHNIGMYRVQLMGRQRLAMHWHMHHDGARHWRSWKAKGQRMPVAIVLGGESVMPYAATAPLPPGLSELLLAGYLNRGGIPLTRAKTVPLWVPANAEIVIEGWVSDVAGRIGWDPRDPDAGELGPGAVFEGPFGDHTGFYSMPDRYPIVEVTAITHRRDAVFPATIVGLPPQEDYYLGKATERVFLPLLKTLIPDIEDYDLPMFGAFHNCAMIKVEKAYPLQGRRVMHSVWGAGQMAWTKTVFVVDDDVDVHDTMAVLRAASARCLPERDVEFVNGPLDILDHAAPRLGAGTKIGFDCTKRMGGEEVGGIAVSRRFAPAAAADGVAAAMSVPGVVEAVVPDACGWMLVRAEKRADGDGRRIAAELASLAAAAAPFIVVVDASVDLADIDRVFFHWCANCDAGRDLARGRDAHGQVVFAFDATAKQPGDAANGEPVRAWPPILAMDEATRALVDRRWDEYGLGERLESPSA